MSRIGVLAFLLFALPTAASAQQVDGNLEGRVMDASGQPLPDASVSVSGPSLQGVRRAVTDRGGHFQLLALPVGEYTVQISHVAHETRTIERIGVGLGATTSLGIVQLTGTVHELPGVAVSTRPPAIDPKTTTLGLALKKSTIDALPTDRDFRSLVSRAPEATVGFLGEEPNVAGSSGEGNYYFIDGTDATDPATAGTSIRLPYDFVKAIEIKTGGYEAEFGRALGGIVNVITPSGGDETHGQVFGYFTDEGLAGKPANSLQFAGPSFSAYDFGGSAGGPIARGRLWWYAAYNPAIDRRDLEVPGIPTQEANSTSHRLAGKLTWQATDRTNLNLTILGDPTDARIVGAPFGLSPPPAQVLNPDAIVANTQSGGINVSVHALHQLRSNILLRGSLSRVHNRSYVTPMSDLARNEPYFYDNETGTASGGYGGENKDQADRFSASASAAAFLADHAFKLGLEYVDNWLTSDHQFGAGMAQQGFITRYSATSYFWFQGFALGEVHVRVPTVYLQDSYRATQRLRINAGLRWDGDYIIDSQGRTALSLTDGFQPRVGLTYLMGAAQHHKLFASWGRFYEQLPASSPGYYFFDSKQVYSNYDHDPRSDPSGASTTVLLPSPPGIGDVKGQYFDEVAAGYETEPVEGLRLGLHARYRKLGQVIEDAYDPAQGLFLLGNPGRAQLSFLPAAKQDYKSVALSVNRSWRKADLSVSYALSRNSGNYQGLWFGNAGPQFDYPDALINADGLLPNDRTHVFKLDGTVRPGFGLTVGASGAWESGTPLNELGRDVDVAAYVPVFLQPRGSVGRAPSLWDVNLRAAYDGLRLGNSIRPRLVLDLFHVGNPRKAVQFDELHYTDADAAGNQLSPNPNYLQPTFFQPSFSARLGAGVAF